MTLLGTLGSPGFDAPFTYLGISVPTSVLGFGTLLALMLVRHVLSRSQNANMAHLLRNILILMGIFSNPMVWGKGRYAELVLPFDSDREINYYADPKLNALVFELKGTSLDELRPLDTYDEVLIKRVLIKDLSPWGVKFTLILKDRNVRGTVDILHEPFRINIATFDRNYTHDRDPVTNLPLASLGGDPQGLKPAFKRADATPEPLPQVPAHQAMPETEGKLKLLQPSSETFQDLGVIKSELSDIPPGRGKTWNGFPPYMYPLVLNAYLGGASAAKGERQSDEKNKALQLADYALHLFTLGNEGQALKAYQQVLYLDPTIFDKSVVHLWAFAECHLGQGNFILADGYYLTLTEKFPESDLASFAEMRRLDIKSLQFSEKDQWPQINAMVADLNRIKGSNNQEKNVQRAIRVAYFGQTEDHSLMHLPKIDSGVKDLINAGLSAVESKRTAFVGASLIMLDLVDIEKPWVKDMGSFAADYITTYQPMADHRFYIQVKKGFEEKLARTLIKRSADGAFLDVVQIFDKLPDSVRNVQDLPEVAWALAEAYRNLNQMEKAITFYRTSAAKSANKSVNFKSYFWVSLGSAELAAQMLGDHGEPAKVDQLTRQAGLADPKMMSAWNDLDDTAKETTLVAYKPHFEAAIREPNKLQTPPKILLSTWTKELATPIDPSAQTQTAAGAKASSPSANTLRLLNDLAKRFKETGLAAEARQTVELMRKITPKSYPSDKEAINIWSTQLTDLAEDYRQDGQLLNAGRLYVFTAENAVDWDKRAEALYKGGLLLFKAGRRDEALAALTSASQDANNLLYANLAKERLTQLKQ